MDWLFATMKILPSGSAKILCRVCQSCCVILSESYNVPREQVRREAPLQEFRRTRCTLLGWEELKAQSGVNVVECRILVHSANNQEAAVKDASSGGVPTLLEKVESSRILKDGTALSCRGGTGLEDADGLLSRLDSRISYESIRIAADAHLHGNEDQ